MAILFSIEFLELRQRSPLFTSYLYGLGGFLILLMGANLADWPVPPLLLSGTVLLVFASLTAAAVYALARGVLYARFFLLA